MKKSIFLLITYIISFCANADEMLFSSYTRNSHDKPNIKFRFSAGKATGYDPISITYLGKNLTSEEMKTYRHDLPRVWVKDNVPSNFIFRVVDSAPCTYKNIETLCSCYVFTNPKNNEDMRYYIVYLLETL